ncbi:hypothetical protein RCL1_000852 [Eukaryota sp. TZLM3-RCL]
MNLSSSSSRLKLPQLFSSIDSSVSKLSSLVRDLEEKDRIAKLPLIGITPRPTHSAFNKKCSKTTVLFKTIFSAVKSGDVTVLQSLFNSQADDDIKVNPSFLCSIVNKKRQNLLHLGCLYNQVGVLKFFASFSASHASVVAPLLSAFDINSHLPLHYAVISGNSALFSAFSVVFRDTSQHLDAILIGNAGNSEGFGALHLAFQHVKLFEQSQEDLTLSSKDDLRLDILDTLINEYNCSPNKRDTKLRTPLHHLVMGSFPHQTKVLLKFLDFDPLVDIEDCYHQTPILYAIKNRNFDCISILLGKGKADPNYIHKRRGNLLNMAVESGCLEAVKLLVQHGADPKLCDFLSWSPLHECVFNSNISPRHSNRKRHRDYIEIANYLIDCGCSMSDRGRFNTIPLKMAVCNSFKLL